MTSNETKHESHGGGLHIVQLALRFSITIVILGIGGFLAWYFLTHKSPAKRKKPEATAALVETLAVHHESQPVSIHAMGIVIPAREVSPAPRINGEIVSISDDLIPGGLLKSGSAIAKIDPTDYKLVVEQREADITKYQAELMKLNAQLKQSHSQVIQAESNLKIEMGRQAVAREETEILAGELTNEDQTLVLRKPQLAAAEAAYQSAMAAEESAKAAIASAESSLESGRLALKKAELDLSRTDVTAPFNSVVIDTMVEKGSHVTAGAKIANLVCTDAYRVEVAVPLDELKWINIPTTCGQTGSAVEILNPDAWGDGVSRTGHVVRLAANLESDSRLAQLIVEVDDPYCLKAENKGKPVMILNTYVRAIISGHTLENAIKLPRLAVHDGDTVWVFSQDSTLDIRKIDIIRGDNDSVFISDGLKDGDAVIVSNLPVPVESMALRTADSKPASPGPNETQQ